MSWDSNDWASLGKSLAGVAPVLGSALGGPVGGALGATIAALVGAPEATPASVSATLRDNPDAFLKLQQLESDERDRVRTVALQEFQAELSDVSDARHQNKDHWMPSAMTVILSIMVGLMSAAILYCQIPEGSKELAYLIVGNLLGYFGAAVTYWLGSSRGSVEKSKALAQIKS